MANLWPRVTVINLCAGLLLFAASFAAMAVGAGVVTHLSGTLTAKRLDGSVKLLAIKSEVQGGDVLSTEQETYARIKFTDGGEIVLRPGTQLKVESYAFDEAKPASGSSVMNLIKGGFRAVTGLIGKSNKDNVNFSTPTATIGIRGTHFGALFCQSDCGGIPTSSGAPLPNGLYVDVASGAVVVTNPAGQQVFQVGQFGYVANPTTPPVIVPPSQGFQVTMPPRISQNNGGPGGSKPGAVDCAVR